MPGTLNGSDILLSGTPKQSKIWLLGTKELSEIKRIKKRDFEKSNLTYGQHIEKHIPPLRYEDVVTYIYISSSSTFYLLKSCI